jgi:hypothetical protein
MNPRYPVYVISKGRWEKRLTCDSLEKMKVPYRVVIEPQEYDMYAEFVSEKKILALPFSNLGKGSIPARNWVWEHSLKEGHERHWILDDNIREFYRLQKNIKFRVTSGTIFRCAEDFVDRYENVALSGFNYELLVPRKVKCPVYYLNTRVYSCILIKNDLPYRWRGRYNEDTDLSLRALKDGWCTILFNVFLADKTATMRMKGGNTDELYRQDEEFDGRLEMAKSLKEQHPDVVDIVWKWGRWQHHVHYKIFLRRNKLVRKKGMAIPEGVDNYDMKLQKRLEDGKWIDLNL